MLGKIGFEWFSAHAEGFLKAVGRKPSGEGSSEVFDARTLRKLLDILTHRVACAAPLTFADYQEMQLHQRPDLRVLGYCAASMPLSLCYLPWRSSARTRRRAGCIRPCRPCPVALAYIVAVAGVARLQLRAA